MMMDILMYLFETYIHSDSELQVDQDELEDELLRAGFHQDDIYKALHWLEDLAALQDTDNQAAITMCSNTSMRVYTSKEISRINMECRGFLLFLEQINVLTTEIREMVIDRVMGLETNEFELDDLKWIILMVLFNVPGNESAYTQMEELLYEDGSFVPGFVIPFLRTAYWRWIRWPDDFNVKIATTAGEYHLYWIDPTREEETRNARRSGATFEPLDRVYDQYQVK